MWYKFINITVLRYKSTNITVRWEEFINVEQVKTVKKKIEEIMNKNDTKKYKW